MGKTPLLCNNFESNELLRTDAPLLSKMSAPLNDVTVIDFTTLAPGPLATLLLANAGAQVIKVERPETGDEMRSYQNQLGDRGVTFSMLNAGKRSVTANLKKSQDLDRIKSMVRDSDVLVEQFRPGVMERLGLDYQALSQTNRRLIYCSISGFGQQGPKSMTAAHDLNYVADAGMLTLGAWNNGKPSIPQLLAADLAGGAYPAVINILLALQKRRQTGRGVYIDVSMTDCLFPLMFWSLGLGWGSGDWPRDGNRLLSGGSPRYQVYRTQDKRFVTVAALEDRFWQAFCHAIQYVADAEFERTQPQSMIAEIAALIQLKSATEWQRIFTGKDTCAVVANTLEEAVQDVHYRTRGVFDRKIEAESGELLHALPMPIVAQLMNETEHPPKVPKLGEHN